MEMIDQNKIYNFDAITFLEQVYEEFGDVVNQDGGIFNANENGIA
ncbi:hypothetical protein [Bacillus xiamenensis]|nr:hypothetical protein [Bacillus xiamenensis]